MSPSVPAAASATPVSRRAPRETGGGYRRVSRDLSNGWVGGVAAGLAEHLGWPVFWLRVGFILTTAASGFGAVLYVGLWLFVRPANARSRGRAARLGAGFSGTGVVRLLVLALIAIAVVASLGQALGGSSIVLPLGVALVGVALLWRQADEAQRRRWVDLSGRLAPDRMILGEGRWADYTRIGVGLLSLMVAGAWIALRGGNLSTARDVLIAAVLGVLGLAIVLGPWIVRLIGELAEERSERVRSQEREEVAAHLHDSVLQTLALIQKTPQDAVRLARSQERDLRAWLYDEQVANGASLATALRSAAAEVEDTHGISIDVVTVSDIELNARSSAVVAAAREAMTNAAKHSQVSRADVYAEVTDQTIEVFVKDRGVGFEPDEVDADRHGVRGSMMGRMRRHGGTAEISSSPGAGAEVVLRMPREETS